MGPPQRQWHRTGLPGLVNVVFASSCVYRSRRRPWSTCIKLNGRSAYLDERNEYPRTGYVRFNDDSLSFQRSSEVVNLENEVRNRLDEIRIGRVVPVPLPLDTEWVVAMVAYGHLQVR
jgi:hypothetical protein